AQGPYVKQTAYAVAWHDCESQAGGFSFFDERATASSPSSSEHSVRLATRLPCCELSVPTSPILGPEGGRREPELPHGSCGWIRRDFPTSDGSGSTRRRPNSHRRHR